MTCWRFRQTSRTSGRPTRCCETRGEIGKLDIVFANAGIPGATPVGHTSLASFEEIIRTNLTAVFFTIQASAPHLNPGASIILNGSVHAVMGVPGYSAYAATKAGVRAMTRTWHQNSRRAAFA